jgi:hypothetical protein
MDFYGQLRANGAKANAGVLRAELKVNGGLTGHVSWGTARTGGTCLSRFYMKLLGLQTIEFEQIPRQEESTTS